MIPNKKGWYYLGVKNYQRYQEEQRLNTTIIFIVSVLFILFQQKTNVNCDFCNVIMPSEGTRILEFNQSISKIW